MASRCLVPTPHSFTALVDAIAPSVFGTTLRHEYRTSGQSQKWLVMSAACAAVSLLVDHVAHHCGGRVSAG